jgi:hypothetical protein
MISLPHVLPHIRVGRSSLALCEPAWLTSTLTAAAEGTDLPEWMAVDISRGVERYLANHYPGTVIDSADLFERIDKTLHALGLDHVAAKVDRTPPPVRISLLELARRAGNGFELAFFQLLEEQVDSATSGGVRRLECHGLERCVRHLAASKKWTQRCDHLRNEITEYLEQASTRAFPAPRSLTLLVAQ